jgi:hypothetical protein
MANSEKIHALKLYLNEKSKPSDKEFLSSSALSFRIPRGALVELSGNSKAEWVVQFLKENKELKVFWCEEKQSVFPTAISQRGVSLDRIVFGVFKEELFSSLRKILQSQSFEVVISPSSFSEIKMLKALQLFSEKSNCTLFLMAKECQSAKWPIAIQFQVDKPRHSGKFEVSVIKNKYSESI